MTWDSYGRFPPYVSVAERKRQAERKIKALKKKGQVMQPVVIDGRQMTKTFWGNAWCENLEAYSDFANRLPRGRSYVRNGSVLDLQISAGKITALVNGSSLYKVNIMIAAVTKRKWEKIVKESAGQIDSLIELLQGKFSQGVMKIMTQPTSGLFPHPKEISLSCSCPDYADMCKHVSAALYGVGARLDERPDVLFLLRQADPADLISKAEIGNLTTQRTPGNVAILEDNDLSSLFGIDIAATTSVKSVKKKIVSKRKSVKKGRKTKNGR